MHYGTTSGSYDYSVDVGNFTSCTISGLTEGTQFFFSATAYNAIGESDFSEEINYTISSELDPPIEQSDEVILDNGNDGTLFNGIWNISSCPEPYGSDSLYSRNQGARYTFEAELNGTYLVSLWWTEHPTNRCSQVPVEIHDGNSLLHTVQVNQQANGGQWNELGAYSFNGTARVTVVSEGGGCSTGADAVEFVAYEAPAPSIYRINASAGSGGSISPAGEVTVSAGSSAIYTVQPNANYKIADVKVDGNSAGAVTSYTFENVSSDHTITASFNDEITQSSSGKSRWWKKWWRRR